MKNSITSIITLFLLFAACVKEDHFGHSPFGNIKEIEIANQASQSIINTDSLTVTIEFPPGIELQKLELQHLKLSSFATSDRRVGAILNMHDTEVIQVTSENGKEYNWSIIPFIASATPSLENGDFNTWYETAEGYYEPGADAASTIWGTGNPGTQILNLLATTPLEIENENYAVKMETLDNGTLAGAFGTPISAGSVFVGKFNKDAIDPSNPQAAINFGTPFSGRPVSMNFKYQYTPGSENKDKDGNVLAYGDQCDIYAYLEVRTGENIQRLATAWFRSGETQSELKSMTLDFSYGPLDNSWPDYTKPENGKYIEANDAAYMLPTHLTFVASSSCNGARFEGAIGSTLILDDVEMIYE